MEHLFCPECWAALFGFLATLPFLKMWATKWKIKLMLKHTEDCDGDACHHDHGEEE